MSAQKSTSPVKKGLKSNAANGKQRLENGHPLFLFGKRNFYLMFAGLGLIVLGFLLMTGAKIGDPQVFDRSEVYSFQRITLAPILIIAGFVVEVFAIMLKPKDEVSEKSE